MTDLATQKARSQAPLILNQLPNFPTRKTEHWKYNDLTHLNDQPFDIVSEANKISLSSKELDAVVAKYGLTDSYRLILVDGIVSMEQSDLPNNDELTLHRIDMLGSNEHPLIDGILSTAAQKKNALLSLNHSINSDSYFLKLKDGATLDRPLSIVYYYSTRMSASISSNQTIVHIGKNSECQVSEIFLSAAREKKQDLENPNKESTIKEGSNLNAVNLELQESIFNLAPDARLKHFRLNFLSELSSFCSRALTIMGRASSLGSFYYSSGAVLNKTDIDVIKAGENATSQISGIYLPKRKQTVDYHTNIQHRVANCQSDEVFRGIIADQSKATFNGKIHIFKNAQKSDAQLSNKNLLLTNQAEINTKPELEIYADDVVCSHGATVAQIDDKAVYYLQSRGIDKQRAKRMLSVGFINELLENVSDESIRQLLQERVNLNLNRLS